MQPTVLICDDNVDIRRELSAVLAEQGLKVYRVQSGSEALKRIRSDDVGVVVLDLRMPRMDGIQTAEKIQAEFPESSK